MKRILPASKHIEKKRERVRDFAAMRLEMLHFFHGCEGTIRSNPIHRTNNHRSHSHVSRFDRFVVLSDEIDRWIDWKDQKLDCLDRIIRIVFEVPDRSD